MFVKPKLSTAGRWCMRPTLTYLICMLSGVRPRCSRISICFLARETVFSEVIKIAVETNIRDVPTPV